MKDILIVILIIILILIIIYLFIMNNRKKENNENFKNSQKKINKKLNKLFYSIDDIGENTDFLMSINQYKDKILQETINVYNNNSLWNTWPEKHLYSNLDGWKIFPFFAFGIWVKDNCEKCPTIYNYIRNIKGLKLATLSKFSPNTKLDLHQGWGSHSNHVIRCHYGLIVPSGCYVYVENEYDKQKRFHKQFDWVIFDDSKFHYAENPSDSDRIVLIIDIERPEHIQQGNSTLGDTKELKEIVDYFKQKNLM